MSHTAAALLPADWHERSRALRELLPPLVGRSFDAARLQLEESCHSALARYSLPPLTETMKYALCGGKCLRGLLLFAVADSCSGLKEQAREAAVAIEMLHAASLVVDDLPALDDTSLRRCTLSVHKRFGEAGAILTAHALVAAAFQVIAHIPADSGQLLRIVGLLADAIGGRGMARAELVERTELPRSDIDIRALKTGGLFQMAAHIGAVLSAAEAPLISSLEQLGRQIGICYQIVDDLRDEVLDKAERKSLRDAGRRSWEECWQRFSSVRPRLSRPGPLEWWLAEFDTVALVGEPE